MKAQSSVSLLNVEERAVISQAHPQPGALFLGGAPLAVDEAALEMAWGLMKEKWLESKFQSSGRKNTTQAYETAYQQFFDWALETWGVTQPWQVSAGLAEDWKNHLLRQGKQNARRFKSLERAQSFVAGLQETDGDDGPERLYRGLERDDEGRHVVRWTEGLSPNSVNLKLAALSSFYSYVRDHPYRAPDGRELNLWPANQPNPWAAVERPKGARLPRERRLTVDDADAILSAINTDCITGLRDKALIATYLVTCLRFDGLARARWGDIRGPLANGKYALTYRYKGGELRDAVLDKLTYQLICEYLRADGRLDTIQPEDFIFVALFPDRARRLSHDPNGRRPISNSTANGILKKYARMASVPLERAHIHGLRRAGSARRYRDQKAGGVVDPVELQKILGHQNLETTVRYIKEELEEPDDPGVEQAAAYWLRERPKRRKKKSETQQRLL